MINLESSPQIQTPEFISTLLVYEILKSKHQEPKLNNLAIQSIHNLLSTLPQPAAAISSEQKILFDQMKIMAAHQQLIKFYHLIDTMIIIRTAVLNRIQEDVYEPRCLMLYEEQQLFKRRYRNWSPANLRKFKKKCSLHTDSTSKNSGVKVYHNYLPLFEESGDSEVLVLQRIELELIRVIGQTDRSTTNSKDICFNIKNKFSYKARKAKSREKQFQMMLAEANISPIQGSQLDQSGDTILEYYGAKKIGKKSTTKRHEQAHMHYGQDFKLSRGKKPGRRRSAEISRRSHHQSILSPLTPKPSYGLMGQTQQKLLLNDAYKKKQKQKTVSESREKIIFSSKEKTWMGSKSKVLVSNKQSSKKKLVPPQKSKKANKKPAS